MIATTKHIIDFEDFTQVVFPNLRYFIKIYNMYYKIRNNSAQRFKKTLNPTECTGPVTIDLSFFQAR